MNKSNLSWIVIFALLAVWMYMSSEESERMMQAQRAYNDSIAAVEQAKRSAALEADALTPEQKAFQDSMANAAKSAAMGVFASAVEGSEQEVVLSNSVVKLVLSSKGDRKSVV